MDTEERVLLQRKTFVIAVGFILFLKEKGGICNINIYNFLAANKSNSRRGRFLLA